MESSVTIDTGQQGVLVVGGKRYTPKRFDVHGKILELYSVRTLAHALNRASRTIIEWESFGLIPPPLYRITGKGPVVEERRFYSREQIINIYQVGNRFPFGPGRHARYRDQFFAAFNHVFDAKEILNVSEISIKPTKKIPPIGSFGYEKSGQPEPVQLVRAKQKNHSSVDAEIREGDGGPVASSRKAGAASGAGRQEPQRIQQHTTGAHSNAHREKPAYRRRPAQSVS